MLVWGGERVSRGNSTKSTEGTLATTSVERAVFVEACQDGWNPKSVVRQLVWNGDTIHEELKVFPSLREALAYAQHAYVTQDGPEPLAA